MPYKRWLMLGAVGLMTRSPLALAQDTSTTIRAQGVVAVAREAARTAGGYAGSSACTECHRAEVAAFAEGSKGKLLLDHPRTNHEKLGCESCHGPAKDHVESGGEERGALVSFRRKNGSPIAVRNATCLGCHERTARMWWQGSNHESRGVGCTDCHTLMHNVSERGNLKTQSVLETCGRCHQQQKNAQSRFAHMPLGNQKMECTSCHNPHGSPNPKLLLASSTNETCFSCHAEKRGPFLWQHPPVVENCANCHDAHGSSHEKMLKVSRPRLCQQCHAGAVYHPTRPFTNTADRAQFLQGRQCQNCHVNIHGSNHPSGMAFTR